MAEIERFIDYFYGVRKFAEFGKQRERDLQASYTKPWGLYNEGLKDYSDDFCTVLDESLVDFLIKKKKTTGHAYALDVMGQGFFYQDAPVDGEVAITLVDFRNEYAKELDQKHNMVVAEGDILSGETWNNVRRFMEENSDTMNGGFDLVTCRPAGGWEFVVPRFDISNRDFSRYASSVEWLIANKMFRLLSPKGGMMVMEMNNSSDYDAWSEKLNKIPGIEAKNDQRGSAEMVKIVKNTDIKKLPRIPQ